MAQCSTARSVTQLFMQCKGSATNHASMRRRTIRYIQYMLSWPRDHGYLNTCSTSLELNYDVVLDSLAHGTVSLYEGANRSNLGIAVARRDDALSCIGATRIHATLVDADDIGTDHRNLAWDG